MSLRNIHNKTWYDEAISLDDLLTRLLAIKEQLNGRQCKVIGVTNPKKPTEAEIISIKTRSELLDHQVGKHLNRLGGEVTDQEIDDTADDTLHELQRNGEVVYVVLGLGLHPAAAEVYEV